MGVVVEWAELAAMLMAQERLGFTMDMAAGTGNLKKGAWNRHRRDLQRLARGSARRRGADPFTRSDADGATGGPTLEPADMGIEVVFVKEKAGKGWPLVEASDG